MLSVKRMNWHSMYRETFMDKSFSMLKIRGDMVLPGKRMRSISAKRPEGILLAVP